MSRELLLKVVRGAAHCLGGEVKEEAGAIYLQLPGLEPAMGLNCADEPAAMAPLHRLAELVRRAAGRVQLVAIPNAVADCVFGSRESVLLARFEATWYSAAPVTLRFGLSTPLSGGPVRPVSAGACATLAAAVQDSGDRVEESILKAAWERLQNGAELQAVAGTQDARARLMSLQSRRRRDIEVVFRTRQMSLDDLAGEGNEAGSAALLERQRSATLEHAEAYYDPNRLTVAIRVTTALIVHPRALRRRSKGHGKAD